MKRRGAARVLGVDFDERYLAQARFAAETLGLEIEFRQLSVYDVAQLGEQFDLVIFMGVLLSPAPSAAGARSDPRARRAGSAGLPIDAARAATKVAPDRRSDHDFWERTSSSSPDFPKMFFIENRYSGRSDELVDSQSRLRRGDAAQCRFHHLDHPEEEVFLCRVNPEGESRHDRSRDVLERAEQQVALGLRGRPGLAHFRRHGEAGGRRREGGEPRPVARARRDVADRSGIRRAACRSSACWIIWTPSRCTASRWIGISGRSTIGRSSCGRSRR